MQSQPLLLRVQVVIFAVLVGSIFVYARAGGSLPFLSRPAQVSPAAVQDVNEPGGGPRIMMGSKSAPAFLPDEPSAPVSVQPVAPETSRKTLLPGSKSAVIITGEDPPPLTVVVPVAPTNTNAAPQAKPSARLLPGSKSIILADPPTLNQSAPAVQRQQAGSSNRGNR